MSTDRDVSTAIERARAAIDQIDRELVALLNDRAERAAEIGRAKHLLGQPVYQPAREDVVFSQVLGANQGPLDDAALRRVFERILDEARRYERLKTQS